MKQDEHLTNRKAGMHTWVGFAVLALPALLISIDVSVMILALPHIGADLGANGVEQLWIMDIYGFMLSDFKNSSFSAALVAMFGITLTGVVMLFVAQHLQLVQGMSLIKTAFRMLPAVVASMSGMLLSPLIARRIRPVLLIESGLAVSATGCFLLSEVDTETGLASLVIGYILFNVGTSPLVSLSGPSGEFAFALGIAPWAVSVHSFSITALSHPFRPTCQCPPC